MLRLVVVCCALWESSSAFLSQASVSCSSTTATACLLGSPQAAHWTARASLDPAQNETGWARLLVETPGQDVDDGVQAYSAGFVEGYVTADLIWDHWRTAEATKVLPSEKVKQFILDQRAFMDSQASRFAAVGASGEEAQYWKHVSLTLLQMEGLAAGYNRAAPELNLPELNESQFIWLNYVVENDDMQKATHVPSRPIYEEMEHEAFFDYVTQTTHCSALFRVTPELDDLFAAHATWWDYSWMLRIMKTYQLKFSDTPADAVLLSGFPAFLVSTDDFYVTSQKLAVVETSNSIFNNSLFDLITPHSVPYWIRNSVANRLAVTGREWHDMFLRYNSGTYNNDWIVVDYKQFTPRQPLRPWTLSVSAQVPGPYSHPGEDLTVALQRGHWPSYNVPFFEDIYNISGYPEMVKLHGVQQSYQLAPRAPIFRRQADQVNDLEDLHHFMRFNSYGTGDRLAKDPTHAIASRGDLKPRRAKASGAIDAKAVNAALVDALAVSAIAGPTTQGQPVFAFTGPWAETPHFGAAERYNFTWQTISADALRFKDTAQHDVSAGPTMMFFA